MALHLIGAGSKGRERASDQRRRVISYMRFGGSRLSEELPFAIGFLALVADGVVAFACTLQGDDLPSKIRADIRAICSQGSPVDRIVVFAAENVPVARRHELQAEARDQHRVDLDIHDGEAISELLADHDLFWTAEPWP